MSGLSAEDRQALAWRNQSIRIEHVVAPGGWLTKPGPHLDACTCKCDEVQTCPECERPTFPTRICGRWDAVNGYTARPFDPVWVRLGCGCEFGNESLAEPIARPATTEHTKEDDR